MLFTITHDIRPNQDFEHRFGEYIEGELEKKGYATGITSATDWGYAFLVKLNNCSFDIIIEQITDNQTSLKISPKQSLLSNFFPKRNINARKRLEAALLEIKNQFTL